MYFTIYSLHFDPFFVYSFSFSAQVPARDYAKLMCMWIERQIQDPTIFPVKESDKFPKDFHFRVKRMFVRMTYVFSHYYYSHVDHLRAATAFSQFNSTFKHFVLFGIEHNLLKPKHWAPIASIVESLKTHTDIIVSEDDAKAEALEAARKANPVVDDSQIDDRASHLVRASTTINGSITKLEMQEIANSNSEEVKSEGSGTVDTAEVAKTEAEEAVEEPKTAEAAEEVVDKPAAEEVVEKAAEEAVKEATEVIEEPKAEEVSEVAEESKAEEVVEAAEEPKTEEVAEAAEEPVVEEVVAKDVAVEEAVVENVVEEPKVKEASVEAEIAEKSSADKAISEAEEPIDSQLEEKTE